MNVPYLVVRIVTHFNENFFEGIISESEKYFDREKAITRENSSTSEIVSDYFKHSKCAFTFDGIKFFRIDKMCFRGDDEGLAVFTFQFVNLSLFIEPSTAFMVMPFGYEKLNQFYYANIREPPTSTRL